MRTLPFFCLLLGCCLAAPSGPEGTRQYVTITDQFLKNKDIVYTAEHDIVKIFAPLKQFNLEKYDLWSDFREATDNSKEPCVKYTVFFVEADIKNNEKTYKGLYVRKNDKVTKLLDNGRDAVANNENVVYFGASDGIYKYNDAANTAEKHGAVTDDIIQLTFYNVTNTIYYVTANHELYKLNTEATSSVKVPAAKDVQAVVYGYDGKIYYYDSKKHVYVFDEVNNKEPVKITGLPASADKLALISPVVGMEEGAILVVDKNTYLIMPDSSSGETKIRVDVKVTAYEPKPTLIQFLAKDKKLYELDVHKAITGTPDLPEPINDAASSFPSLKANCP